MTYQYVKENSVLTFTINEHRLYILLDYLISDKHGPDKDELGFRLFENCADAKIGWDEYLKTDLEKRKESIEFRKESLEL